MQTFQYLQRASVVEALVLSAQLNSDHVVFSSVMQTKQCHTGQCMENVVGLVAQQYRVSAGPAERGWADMWKLELCQGATSRNALPICVAESTRLFVIHDCVPIFMSLLVLALSEMISLCLTLWLLKNTGIFRFTFH